MYRILWAILLCLSAQGAFAETCPPSYRFVDFGREDSDGVLRRGGVIFRAFDENGTRLLLPERSICRAVEEVSKDGRALPIPVVASVGVDLAVAGLDLVDLQLVKYDDSIAEAEANAVLHRETLARPDTVTWRGDSALCVEATNTDRVSCQIVSPYVAIAPLVIYCEAGQCQMPVLARDEELAITATWDSDATSSEALAQEIMGKVQEIYDFLEEQI